MVRLDIGKMYEDQFRSLRQLLGGDEIRYVSLTVDLWSDRRVRSYMGITAHFVEKDSLSTAVLCCRQFEGKA